MDPPAQFRDSYQRSGSWPSNLIPTTLSTANIHSYGNQLDAESERLFEQDSTRKHFSIRFRDLNQDGSVLAKQDTASDEEVRAHLRDHTLTSSSGVQSSTSSCPSPDPACRFVIFSAKDSREPLDTSRSSLGRVLTYHQVMPHYVDLLCVFGKRHEASEPSFFAFKSCHCLASPNIHLKSSVLNRSGRFLQFSYLLRSVDSTLRGTGDTSWSIRPLAVYHRFDAEHGNPLWIITRGNREDGKNDIYERIKDVTGRNGHAGDLDYSTPESQLKASLGVHLTLFHHALKGWGKHMESLTLNIQTKTRIAVIGKRRRDSFRHEYAVDELGPIQAQEERVSRAMLAVEGNARMAQQLRLQYEQLSTNKGFHAGRGCLPEFQQFSQELRQLEDGFTSIATQGKILMRITDSRKELILHYMQGQTDEKMTTLTIHTRNVAIESQHEALTMRIITFVTLVFLPATFVSSFFSTDVVKYQGFDFGQYSNVAMERWLEITLPLTIVTVGAAFIFYCLSRRRMRSAKDTATDYAIELNAEEQGLPVAQLVKERADGRSFRSALFPVLGYRAKMPSWIGRLSNRPGKDSTTPQPVNMATFPIRQATRHDTRTDQSTLNGGLASPASLI